MASNAPATTSLPGARDYRQTLEQRGYRRVQIERTEKRPGDLVSIWDPIAREHRWVRHDEEIAA